MAMAAAELPDDVDALKAMVVAMVEERARIEARNAHLQARNVHLETVNKTADERILELTAIVKMLERARYLLVSELAMARNCEEPEVEDLLTGTLSKCSLRLPEAGDFEAA